MLRTPGVGPLGPHLMDEMQSDLIIKVFLGLRAL